MIHTGYDYMAERLVTWLAPDVLLSVAGRLQNDRDAALAQSSIVIASSILSPQSDGGLVALAEAYLQRFLVPETVIQLAASYAPDIPKEVWSIITALRFEGQLLHPKPGLAIPTPGFQPVFVVCDRDIVVDLLTQPLQGLQGMVAATANTWMKTARAGLKGDRVFLQHSSADPFGAWLDGTVAAMCGFPSVADPCRVAPPSTINWGYRRITMVNWRPGEEALIAICRSSALNQAEDTRQPLPPNPL